MKTFKEYIIEAVEKSKIEKVITFYFSVFI